MPSNQHIIFGAFRLDLVNECLWRESQAIALAPKEFAVLLYLVRNPGRLVTKEELIEAVWPETMVSDGVLKVSIRKLRVALDDNPKSPRFIETAHRRGYRFIGQIAEEGEREGLRDGGTEGQREGETGRQGGAAPSLSASTSSSLSLSPSLPLSFPSSSSRP